ncbi:hypothetical protein BTR14_09870 [Rhizobium rhizosphaerae]|uniref:L,D-TPase catalytic domain-containing protein n=1 Tax=Xaviernesmea rhizosphaerae TaxID=1672749 RepID=A0ABX3PE19_9HYPH|nr:hypothetical protein BTR14_09870 [Xaviernesmea rhizosphaerae]
MDPCLSAYSRRAVLMAGMASILAACDQATQTEERAGAFVAPLDGAARSPGSADMDALYAARADGGYLVPAIPYRQIPQRFHRQRVAYSGRAAPGTIVVETQARLLFLVEPGGTAMRYGIAVGSAGFAWKGEGVIGRRQAWPRWTPPPEMLARKPGLTRYVSDEGSMAPGLSNPLGARALYIFQNGRDTLYRIHGSPEWQTIGRAASSGCVRLINQDAIDLYNRVQTGSRVIVS